jgi:proline iminopeptidase
MNFTAPVNTTAAPARSADSAHTVSIAIEPYDTRRIKVDQTHELYVEQVGNPTGPAVLIVHGGPGGGVSPSMRCFFPPTVRQVLFDQRGAGKSTPAASLENNTTWHLVQDIEVIRRELQIDRWVVFGGSWGSTLALAYAETHPDRVKALVLRGIFTLRRAGALVVLPERAEWRRRLHLSGSVGGVPGADSGRRAPRPHFRLLSPSHGRQCRGASPLRQGLVHVGDGHRSSSSIPRSSPRARIPSLPLKFARIECHYFVNGGFFESDSQLLDNASRLAQIPTVIVQGRYDLVCPMTTAWELHKRMPHAKFVVVADAGHSAGEIGISSALVQACDEFSTL